MAVERLIVGQLSTNCYLYYGEDSGEAFIIDPGDDADFIMRRIQDLGLKPKAILATHGHFDHLLGVTELKLAFSIPFYLHKADLPMLARAQKTAEYFTGVPADPPPKVDKFLKEAPKTPRAAGHLRSKASATERKAFGDARPRWPPAPRSFSEVGNGLLGGGGKLKVIETPGHTPGGVSFFDGKNLFSGDLIFAGGGLGRTDLQGGNYQLLQKSIKKILKLPEETIVYPGHGKSFRLGMYSLNY